MAHFDYLAQCPGGSAISGVLEAATHDAALRQLAELNLQAIQLTKCSPPKPMQPLGADDFIFFNEQLASLASAGMCLDEGLRQLARDVESPRLRRVIDAIADDLRRGVPLEHAVANRERDLPVLYHRVVKAGIKSGQLPATLLNLSQHMRMLRETKRIIVETLAYPVTVFVFAIAIVSVVMIYVVPMFTNIFFDFDIALPGATIMLIGIANVFPALLVVAGILLLACSTFWFVLRASPGGRRRRERIVMSVPLIGAVARASLIARFARSLALTVSSGVPFPESLRLAAGATRSAMLDLDAEALATHVEEGRSPAEISEKMRLIPPMFGFVVEIAVGRNSLPESLFQLAKAYDLRAAHSRSMLRGWLIPLSVFVVGATIGLCIISLFMPLISLINSMCSVSM